jgi:hypothetical protein
VRAITLALIAAAVLLPAASASPKRRVAAGAGLSVVVPQDWQLSRTPITVCGDPVERLVAMTGRLKLRVGMRVPPRAALVLLMEGSSGRSPARPTSFALPRLGNLGGCCEIPTGRGAELLFRDQGRRFYAFVYVSERAPPAARRGVLRLLNSLRVSHP